MGRRGNGEGEIEKLPSGKFRARRSKMIGGELIRESQTFEKRTDAVTWLAGHREPSRAGTVGEWIDTWLAIIRPDRAASTFAGYRVRVERQIRPHLGKTPLRNLDGLCVAHWLAKLAEEGQSDYERHKAGVILRTIMKCAVKHRQIAVDPTAGIALPSSKSIERRSMSPEELTEMIMAARPVGLEHVWRLWADAGLRPAEMYSLEWADIDFDNGTVKVKRGLDVITNKVKEPKTKGSRRTIELAPSTVESLLAARPVGRKLLLPNSRNSHYWQANFHKVVWIPLRDRVGIPWVTPYTFRHTMATLLLRAKVPLKVVSERLGHADVTTTLKHYSHVLEGDQKEAANVMERLLNPVPHELPTKTKKPRKPRA